MKDLQKQMEIPPGFTLGFKFKEKYIHAVVRQMPTPLSLMQQWTEVIITGTEYHYKKILLESYSGLNTYMDILLFRDHIARISDLTDTEIAIVCPLEYMRSYAFLGELIRRETGARLKLFNDVNQAREWLMKEWKEWIQ